ncbi:acetyl-CoA synthetase-like protein [Massarina eburnea CBS 473.64]|uniref:Acetyl-CoA synthetase-like protein n=1 Tax=Massarina eburnea CBS 473.64 TaxID=1395130 RepID=A0A6A6SCH8_9PLEO|nr:acetyl-CoA synthetase-like protein [Massarina eburnea CBS 473.64]
MPFWETVMESPPDSVYGKRLLPAIVDEVAVEDPERICFSFPRSSDLGDGFQDMNFRTFANAINKTAHFIQREIGCSTMFETILYMGDPDVRHFIVLIALMKTGHKVLFSSHHNSVAGHAHLIQRTDCGIILYSSGFPITRILELCRLESVCMPELDYLLDDTPCQHYPYAKSFEEAKHQPCILLHTSGSTGMPKLVTWTHWMISTMDSQNSVAPLDGRPCLWGETILQSSGRGFSALPIFHGAGIATAIARVCFSNSSVVLGPPGLATADVFAGVLDRAGFDSANCVPVTLEEIATRPDVLEKVRKLKHITYVGGSLSKAAGDTISQYTQLYAIMASTEASIITQHTTDTEDWQYVCLNPDVNGFEMRQNGHMYELVFVKKAHQADHQGIFKIFPRLEEYSTSDLFSKHPTKPNHWKHESRTDDIIIFKNGWNFNPIVHEYLIASLDPVKYCLLVGTGRDMPAAIIELHDKHYDKDKQEIISALSSHIDEANSFCDSIGQLRKDCIIFANKEKTFAITGKGTVQRKATVAMYSHEIDRLYASVKSGGVNV